AEPLSHSSRSSPSSSFETSLVSSHSYLGTSHTLSVPLPRRKHQLSSFSTSSPSVSVGPSRKRCRSPTTSLHTAVSALAILCHVEADRLPPRTRFMGSLTASHEDGTIEASVEDIIKPTAKATPEVVAEPVIPSVHLEQMAEEMLEDYEETMQGMYEHLFEIPLPKIEDDVHTLRDMLTAFEGVSTNLRKRVRSLELSELSLRNSLRTARAERAEMQFQVRYTVEQLQ
nr:hypothetical protein [Tanacetum cinerariifolium]